MLAVLNSVVLSLMDLHHVPNVARQRRRFASHPHEALDWVLDFCEALGCQPAALAHIPLLSVHYTNAKEQTT